jgi:hypothetical protein
MATLPVRPTVQRVLKSTITAHASADEVTSELPEPVRRYLRHALPAELPSIPGVRLKMTGTIRLAFWLPFTAVQRCDGHSFEWRARVGRGWLAPLEVVDRYDAGGGSVTGQLFGCIGLFDQADEDVRRSAAGRAALEAVMAPASLLPGNGVSWRAENDEHIVASSYLDPEQIEVHLQIDLHGSLRTFSAQRWGPTGRHSHGYLTFGGDIHAERRFGDIVVPSQVTAGWRYGSPAYKPFFKAQIRASRPE